ncbi:hypothetical protein [Dyadobacter jejuensis]|nr:hypothetical protein [Dyadobacter jejuensis]
MGKKEGTMEISLMKSEAGFQSLLLPTYFAIGPCVIRTLVGAPIGIPTPP